VLINKIFIRSLARSFVHLGVGVNVVAASSVVRAELNGAGSRVDDVQPLHGPVEGEHVRLNELVDGEPPTTGAVQVGRLHARLATAGTPEQAPDPARTVVVVVVKR